MSGIGTIIAEEMMLADGQLSVTVFDGNLHSVDELTSLLHRAYQKMAGSGLYFLAADQSVAKTLERIEGSVCLVALKDQSIIGTICYYPSAHHGPSKWFLGADVGHFGQFAVDPENQKVGLGRLLITIVEKIAGGQGKRHLALDTAEKADNLLNYYHKLGFRQVEYIQWPTMLTEVW